MQYPFFTSIGSLSVTLFFVLSGFLITYLLLNEKEDTGNVDVRNFYMKRILRIWPLYFLTILVALFILNKIDFFHCNTSLEYIFRGFNLDIFLLILLPNIAAITLPTIPYLQHIWSIGIEEQFYLIWPWIIRHTKNYLKIFIAIIISFVMIGAVLRFTVDHIFDITIDPIIIKYIKNLHSCFSMYRFGAMAIGGIGAWLLFYKKENFLKFIYKREVQWATVAVTAILFIVGPNIIIAKHELYSLLFCIIIINLASNPLKIISLENKTLNFLGEISYGIYMYHPFVIGACIGILKQRDGFTFGNFLPNLMLYVMTLFITIGISILSYYLFEHKILKVKERYT